MEKKDFIGIMLKDLSELKFNKAYKVLFAILGFALPMLPIIFIYRQDWFKRFELIGTFIIIFIINAMLLMGSASIFIYARFKRCRKRVKEVRKKRNDVNEEMKSIKEKYEDTKYKTKMVVDKKGAEEIEKEIEENEKEITKVEEQQKNIGEELEKLEKDFNTESVINYGVKIAILVNVVIGFFVVILKVLDVIWNNGVFRCDFKGMTILVVLEFIFLNLTCVWWVMRGKI